MSSTHHTNDDTHHINDDANHTNDERPCKILALPVEIRILIFHYLFANAVIHYKPRPGLLYRNRHLAILAANRQIYLESRPILEQQTRLLIQGPVTAAILSIVTLAPPYVCERMKVLKLLCPSASVYWDTSSMNANTNTNPPTQAQTQLSATSVWKPALYLPTPSSLIATFPALQTLHLYDDIHPDAYTPSYDILKKINNASLTYLISNSCVSLFSAVAMHMLDFQEDDNDVCCFDPRYEFLATVQIRCRQGDGSFARLTALMDVNSWTVLGKKFESCGDEALERDALEDED